MTAALTRDLGPTSPLWDDARIVLSLLGVSQAEVDYWGLVSPKTHLLGHPGLKVRGCLGCLVAARDGGSSRG